MCQWEGDGFTGVTLNSQCLVLPWLWMLHPNRWNDTGSFHPPLKDLCVVRTLPVVTLQVDLGRGWECCGWRGNHSRVMDGSRHQEQVRPQSARAAGRARLRQEEQQERMGERRAPTSAFLPDLFLFVFFLLLRASCWVRAAGAGNSLLAGWDRSVVPAKQKQFLLLCWRFQRRQEAGQRARWSPC